MEIFSEGWSKEVDGLARHVLGPPPSPDRFDLDWPRSLSVELIAVESGAYYISWLELSRRLGCSSIVFFCFITICEIPGNLNGL